MNSQSDVRFAENSQGFFLGAFFVPNPVAEPPKMTFFFILEMGFEYYGVLELVLECSQKVSGKQKNWVFFGFFCY